MVGDKWIDAETGLRSKMNAACADRKDFDRYGKKHRLKMYEFLLILMLFLIIVYLIHSE